MRTEAAALPPELAALAKPDAAGLVDLPAFIDAFAAWAHVTGREVDLVAAGILLARAWEALRVQYDELVEKWAPSSVEAASEAFADDPWVALEEWADSIDPDARRILEASPAGMASFRPPPRHGGLGRKVTLMELVEALEEARVEAQRRVDERTARDEARLARAREPAAAVVPEDSGADVRALRSRLPKDVAVVELASLRWEGGPTGVVAALAAALQLARAGDILLEQEFPWGSIFVRRA